MRSFFFVFFAASIAALCLAKTSEYEFNVDYNLTNAEGDFSFRYIKAEKFDLVLADALGWSSVSVDVNTASQQSKATANAMIGVGVLPSVLTLPFALLGYGTGEVSLEVNWKDFLKDLISLKPKLNVGFQGGFIAMAALGLQEVDSDGNTVGDFIPLTYSPSIFDRSKEVGGDEGNVKGLSLEYSPPNCKADVTITYVTAKRAGIIGYGETPVSPRSYEMIIEVDGFSLSSKKNHVRLSLGFLSATGTGYVDGNAKIVRREGQEDLYIAASNRAIVDGDREEVSVSIETGAGGFDTSVQTILNAALGRDFDSKIAYVDFPAGAKSFIYDPAMGSGKVIYEASANTFVLSFFVIVLCTLFYLF